MMPAIGLLPILIFLRYANGQSQPTIDTNSLTPIVGQEQNLTCSINSNESTSTFPLLWYKDNATLTAHREETIAPEQDGVTKYTSLYNFTVKAADNLKVISCVANFSSGITEAAYIISVNKGPDNPVVNGPHVTVSGRSSSWICVVDGATNTAPNVFWMFDNGTSLNASLYQNTESIYIDSNNLEIHKVTSIVTLNVTSGAPSIILMCKAFLYKTDSSTSASIAVTVYSPPEVNGGGRTYNVTSGNNVTLDCTIVSDPPLVSVTWYKDYARVSMSQGRYSGGLPQSPSLTISGVTNTDMGYYLCSGSNDVASSNGTDSYLNVTYSKELDLPKDKSNSVKTIALATVFSVAAAGGIAAALLIYSYLRRSSSKKDKTRMPITTSTEPPESDPKIKTGLNVSSKANGSSLCNSNTPRMQNPVLNQTDTVDASTNPYSEVNHLYQTMPLDAPSSQTKDPDTADGVYQVVFPSSGSIPSPPPSSSSPSYTLNTGPLHDEAGYAIPNPTQEMVLQETEKGGEYNTLSLASNSQTEVRPLDDTYHHLHCTEITPL